MNSFTGDEVAGKSTCEGRGEIEIRDSYADLNGNGTWWRLCEASIDDAAPLAINSYLNTLHIRQINKPSNKHGVRLNVSVTIKPGWLVLKYFYFIIYVLYLVFIF